MDSSSVNNRSFLGALAAAIKAFCMLFIDGMSVAQEGIKMADTAVKTAREKQVIELGIAMRDYAEIAIAKATIQQAQAKLDVKNFLESQKTPENRELVAETQKNLTEYVNQKLAELRAERAQ